MSKLSTPWIPLMIAALLGHSSHLHGAETDHLESSPHQSRLLVVHHKNNAVLGPLEEELAVELRLVLDDTTVGLHGAPTLWYTADSLNETERLFEMLAVCLDNQAGAMIELVSRGDAVEQLRLVVILSSGAIGRSMTLPTPVDRADNLALVIQALLDEALLFEEYRKERGKDPSEAAEPADWTKLVSLAPPVEAEKKEEPPDRVSLSALALSSLPVAGHKGSAFWFGGELVLRWALIGDLHGVIDLAFQGGHLSPTDETLSLDGWRLWPGIGLDYDWRWNRFGLELYTLGEFTWTLLELGLIDGPSSTSTFWGFRLDAGVGGRWYFHERIGLVLRTAFGINAYRDALSNLPTGGIVFQTPLLEWSASVGLEYYLL